MSKIKELRQEKGLMQEELARLLNISLPNYSKKENGIIKFSIVEAKILAGFFGLTIEELFFENEFSKTENSQPNDIP